MTNKPMLSERDKFEAFWRSTMNVQDMDLHRCEFPMTAYDDQPYACHETERGRLTWMARAGFGHQVNQPSDPVAVFEIDASGYRARIVLDPAKPFPSSGTKLYAEQLDPAEALPQFDMQMVMMCLGGVRGAVLTSNQCHALAQMLNACSAEVARLNGVKP